MNTLMLSAAVMFAGLFPMSGLFGHMGNSDFNMMGNSDSSSMMSGFTSNRNNSSSMMNDYSNRNNSSSMMNGYSNNMMNDYSYDDMMDNESGYNCH
ncbi:hypothetical protein R2F61_01070 [Mollicutes bacterium LVI A0078]|nr:hypothetical protein RZE84_01070 [Mollicutes bacterium LVI A0075]WOO91170.1 hypothetical protein R2F61_01070 [Mollicutes bacterium LVI A0078]